MDITPMNDLVFQFIFGKKENTDLLLNFINPVLKPIDETPIQSLQITETSLNPDLLNYKGGRLDLLARSKSNELFNIEVQVCNEYNIEKRTLYYWSRLFSKQLKRGETYKYLERVVNINLLDFSYFEDGLVHSICRIREETTGSLLSNLLEIHFLELTNLPPFPNTQDLHDPLTCWLLFFKGADPTTREVLKMNNKSIEKAYEELERFQSDEKAMRMYELREKALKDEASLVEGAVDKGREEGREEGRREGKREVVFNLIEKGFDDAFIMEVTQLSQEQLKKVKSL